MQIIHQEIIEKIYVYLDSLKKNFSTHRFEFDIFDIIDGWYGQEFYQVEVRGYFKDEYHPDRQTPFIMLRFSICYEYNEIQVSNIFLPPFMRYKGIGKTLLQIMFTVAEIECFYLFLVDMVPSFYQRMMNRGAIPCDGYDDVVQIVKQTKLV